MTADLAKDDIGAAAVAAARRWVGTPYRHGASAIGAGADCLGLVRGVWRALYGAEPQTVPAYTADWGEAAGEERLLEAARRHMICLSRGDERPGDVLLFRMRQAGPAKHLGVLAAGSDGAPTVIHAYSGRGVVESPLGAAWRRRIAAVFRLPGRNG